MTDENLHISETRENPDGGEFAHPVLVQDEEQPLEEVSGSTEDSFADCETETETETETPCVPEAPENASEPISELIPEPISELASEPVLEFAPLHFEEDPFATTSIPAGGALGTTAIPRIGVMQDASTEANNAFTLSKTDFLQPVESHSQNESSEQTEFSAYGFNQGALQGYYGGGAYGQTGFAPADASVIPWEAPKIYIPSSRFGRKKKGKPSHAKKSPVRLALKILVFVLSVVLLAIYGQGVWYFSSHMYPNTSIGTLDVSYMTVEEAQKVADDFIDSYILVCENSDFNGDLTSENLHITSDASDIINEEIAAQNSWLWFIEIAESHSLNGISKSYDHEAVEAYIKEVLNAYNAGASEAVDATYAYDEESDSFVVVPSVAGRQYDEDMVLAAVQNALENFASSYKIEESCVIQPLVTEDNLQLLTFVKSLNDVWLGSITLVYEDQVLEVVEPSTYHQWMTFDSEGNFTINDGVGTNEEDGSIVINDEGVASWALDMYDKYSTIFTERTYTRPTSLVEEVDAEGKTVWVERDVEKTITVGVGADDTNSVISGYGYRVNTRELINLIHEAILAGNDQTITMPFSSVGQVFTGEAGQRDWGTRYIDIDLYEQYARFYDENGEVIWESVLVSGVYYKDKLVGDCSYTPTGVYYVYQKKSPSVLYGTNWNGTSYRSTVDYWMPFIVATGWQIGLHDADWQPWDQYNHDFFKTWKYGSHGCVNLPDEKAKELYSLVQKGDVVVVHW